MITRFLLLLLCGTLFQMLSGVPHHCHHLSLVWILVDTCFIQFTKTEHSFWSLYISAWFVRLIDLLTTFLIIVLMCIKKYQTNYILFDCLHVLMFLHIVLAYLMLFTALFNTVCLHNACLFLFFSSTFDLLFVICFCFHALSLGYWHIVVLFQLFFLHHVHCF